ncbi:MAG: alpha/beta hydrolase [Deltaproteobacteria bacterium]|nr:alpha/beta hydrolase [Deltaproteobacteria bacterium]
MFPSRASTKKNLIILQFHGNGENMTSHYTSLAWTTKKGFELITFDYRGYGKSEGELGHKGVLEDAIAAYNFAKKRALETDQKIILYGQSLGATILLKAIEEFKDTQVIHSVFIEGGFLNHKEMANEFLSRFWITWPFQWLPYLVVNGSYSPDHFFEYFPAGVPLIVIHGEKDEIIPIRFGKEIYSLAKPPKRWILAKDKHHIDTMFDKNYRNVFLDMIKFPPQ